MSAKLTAAKTCVFSSYSLAEDAKARACGFGSQTILGWAKPIPPMFSSSWAK